MALTVLEGIMEGLRHQGRPRRQWIHDIEEWTGCKYIQLKEMSQDRAQCRRKISEWSSAVANPHRGRSTSEWVSEWVTSKTYSPPDLLCITLPNITTRALLLSAGGYCFWARHVWVCGYVCGSSLKMVDLFHLLYHNGLQCSNSGGGYVCCASHCRFTCLFLLALQYYYY